MQSRFDAGNDFDQLIQAPTPDAPDTDEPDEPDEPDGPDAASAEPSTYFPSLEVFVTKYLVHHYPRPVDRDGPSE